MDSSFERSTPKKRPTFSECTTELLSSSAMACGRDRWAGGRREAHPSQSGRGEGSSPLQIRNVNYLTHRKFWRVSGLVEF